MYLKVFNHLDKCLVDGKVNKSYIYVIIRNIAYSSHSTKVNFEEINNNITIASEDYIEEYDVIDDVLNQEYWYDKKLFELYLIYNSYRKIEELTGINYRSIARSVCHVKRKLKQKAWEIQSHKLQAQQE